MCGDVGAVSQNATVWINLKIRDVREQLSMQQHWKEAAIGTFISP